MTKTLNADRTLSVISMVATLVALGIIIEGRMAGSAAGDARPEIKKVAGWIDKSSTARSPLNAAVGPVQVDVFTDFQCPFCRLMDSTLNRLEATFPGKLARAIVHFPLASHTHARGAASAFECASRQGRAAAMHSTLYREHERLGVLSWEALAAAAEVADLQLFTSCMTTDEGRVRIEAGERLARLLTLQGTPSVVVNGFLITPSLPATVEKAVGLAVLGKSPK